MTTPNTAGINGGRAVHTKCLHRRESLIAFVLVLFAVAFNLYHLFPEVAVKVTDPNDTGMHLLATELAVESITQGLDFTDPWMGSIGMGFSPLPLLPTSPLFVHSVSPYTNSADTFPLRVGELDDLSAT